MKSMKVILLIFLGILLIPLASSTLSYYNNITILDVKRSKLAEINIKYESRIEDLKDELARIDSNNSSRSSIFSYNSKEMSIMKRIKEIESKYNIEKNPILYEIVEVERQIESNTNIIFIFLSLLAVLIIFFTFITMLGKYKKGPLKGHDKNHYQLHMQKELQKQKASNNKTSIQLKTLKTLYDSEILTQEEYSQKRDEIINGLPDIPIDKK